MLHAANTTSQSEDETGTKQNFDGFGDHVFKFILLTMEKFLDDLSSNPRGLTNLTDSTLDNMHSRRTHTPQRKVGRQVNVFADHAAVFTCIKEFNAA